MTLYRNRKIDRLCWDDLRNSLPQQGQDSNTEQEPLELEEGEKNSND